MLLVKDPVLSETRDGEEKKNIMAAFMALGMADEAMIRNWDFTIKINSKVNWNKFLQFVKALFKIAERFKYRIVLQLESDQDLNPRPEDVKSGHWSVQQQTSSPGNKDLAITKWHKYITEHTSRLVLVVRAEKYSDNFYDEMFKDFESIPGFNDQLKEFDQFVTITSDFVPCTMEGNNV